MAEKVNEGMELITVPQDVLPKVIKIIKGYNKKAAEWGYELLSYNEGTHTISGKFTPKDNAEKTKKGFFSEMKEAYKNGDLGEEWGKILKLCGLNK